MKYLVLFFFALCLCNAVVGSDSFNVYRTFQFTKDQQNLGSHKSGVNFLSTSYRNSYDENLSRSRAIFLPFEEFIHRTEQFRNGTYPEILTSTTISNYQRTIAGASSTVFVTFPQNLTKEQIPKWRDAESTLIQNELLIPVYFVEEQDKLTTVLQSIEKSTFEASLVNPWDFVLSDNYQLIVSAKEPTALKSVTGVNLQGWLAGGGDSSSTPIIAVFAHYDSFSAISGLSQGAERSIAPSVMVLELSRIFSRLYSVSRTQSKYNILFILTSGGEFNYQGSKHWLKEADDRILKSLDFALCLDAFSGDISDELFLHTSRPVKDPTAKKFYESFTRTAKQLGRKFQVVQNKVNFTNTEEPWEHEHFSKVKVLASTLSSQRDPLPLLGRSNAFDTRAKIDAKAVKQNILLVAESLAKYIFDISSDDLQIFKNSYDVDELFVDSWMDTLANNERVLPYIESSLIDGLEQALRVYATDVTKSSFVLDKTSGYTFYSTPAEPFELTTHVVKPFIFDVFLALAIFGYLSALYFAVKFFWK